MESESVSDSWLDLHAYIDISNVDEFLRGTTAGQRSSSEMMVPAISLLRSATAALSAATRAGIPGTSHVLADMASLHRAQGVAVRGADLPLRRQDGRAVDVGLQPEHGHADFIVEASRIFDAKRARGRGVQQDRQVVAQHGRQVDLQGFGPAMEFGDLDLVGRGPGDDLRSIEVGRQFDGANENRRPVAGRGPGERGGVRCQDVKACCR